jgi:hypothetical protein
MALPLQGRKSRTFGGSADSRTGKAGRVSAQSRTDVAEKPDTWNLQVVDFYKKNSLIHSPKILKF